MRIHGHTLLFWLALLLLGPLLLWQGRQAKKTIPRLPEAAGDTAGHVAGEGGPLRVLFVGESTAVGVGVTHRDESLVGHFSRGLARQRRRAVHWRLLGHNGATVAELLPKIAAMPAEACDLVLLAIGANDAKALRSPRQWRADLRALVQALQHKTGRARICISAMPPMGQFPALPQPLRWLMGVQARRLDLVTQALCRAGGEVRHVVVDFGLFRPELFASDGFHPSGAGYARWAACLQRTLET
jgi:lysophospholipase L1-like esterase